MQQEVFYFKNTEHLSWDDFIESDENREALVSLMRWPEWARHVLMIFGESGTGKTHLAGLWAQTANAVYLLRDSLNCGPRELFESDNNFVIDNFDDLFCDANHDDWLFHFLNILQEKNKYLLILGRCKSVVFNIKLHDLKSRLLACPIVEIQPPKDDLLFYISKKISKDLEVYIPDDVLLYILRIIDRNVTALRLTLTTLDKLSLQCKKPITIAFVKQYLNGSFVR